MEPPRIAAQAGILALLTTTVLVACASNSKEAPGSAEGVSNTQESPRSAEEELLRQILAVADLDELSIEEFLRDPTKSLHHPALSRSVPRITGRVEAVVAGDYVKILMVEEAPAVAAGLRFAVYRDNVYKGEAIVLYVEGQVAHCRMELSSGKSVVPGDSAATRFD